ncbi:MULTISPECIES: ArsR/SmtB family transcription factor [Amycolatopsis]|uniref:ArsR family transcriptional regulator n=1 Tax=Amycolatopsis echigonensis TaxID=2576905 RepID=A0A2N3WLJ0_9PSEU|nr:MULTISPECIES: metalloregulator ArsR/SmtB family transcription factor [Amycolatopsis]MBB2500783.1 winged helix-turn-helix transcriptional regulator [Amycolatopsis echigonensis]MCG3751260.1 winged helix-turn-helix transcriptional regulator [Amycolatopsis sp. Poz14]PKV94725.1 ArsR family transcriptional regulator [Amycolatopsis niigatensis]
MAGEHRHNRTPVPVTLLLAEPAAAVTDTDAHQAAALFKALADPLRIRLVSLIRYSPGGEACFCDLAEEFAMPQPTLSHHLRVLVSAGLLTRERRGTWSWYRLVPEPLETLRALLDTGGPLVDQIAPVADTDRNKRC